MPEDADDQRALLRALMNVRPPAPVAAEMLAVQDAYLAERLHERGGAVDAEALPPVDAADPVLSRVALWRGDITRLAADATIMCDTHAHAAGANETSPPRPPGSS